MAPCSARTSHPEKVRRLWLQGDDWSASVCDGANLEDLDPKAITKAREQFLMGRR